MAYVSICWGKSAAHHLNYAMKDRAPDDVTYAHDCNSETAVSDFESVRTEHGKEDGNQILHVMQSFSADESTRFEPEYFNRIGVKLASEKFPNHQFVVRTHTDTDKTHNHIIINTVNSETGKKIENKRALIQSLRDSSDNICTECGLSIINSEAKDRSANLPLKVQQMVRSGKNSYIFDLSQKADVARSIATNFDEYRDTMQAFNIRVVVEEKTISYFYPGRERAKRGSKLGINYDKAGLTEAFTANHDKFTKAPEFKTHLLEQSAQIAKFGMPKIPDGVSRFQNLWSGEQSAWSVPTPNKLTRRNSKSEFQSDRALESAFVPANEIKKAKGNSIFEYCKQNSIGLTKNANGETVLRGREFVVVSEFGFKNNKNQTQGSLIDLVAAHKNLTLLQAVAHINGNNRLLLLEHHAGEVSQKFKSFYVPKNQSLSAAKATAGLSDFFQKDKTTASFKLKLHESAMRSAGIHGGVWIFIGGDDKSNRHSSIRHDSAMFVEARQNRSFGFIELDKKDERSLDFFLIENPHVKKINLFSFLPTDQRPAQIFFDITKRKYEKFGIEIVNVPDARELQKSFEFASLQKEKSRGKGGPSIDF